MSSPLRPAPAVECGPVMLVPVTTTGHVVLIGYRHTDRPIDLTREQGAQLRDALTAWLDPTPATAETPRAPQATVGGAEPPAQAPPAVRDLCAELQQSIDRARADFDGGAS